MRNGSLPTRILHVIQRRQVTIIRTVDFVDRDHSPQAVSRALGTLVREHRIERVARGLYRVLPNKPPVLAFNRAWSNPGAILPPEKMIAVTLARPTFRDVTRICKAFGVTRVRQVLEHLAVMHDVPEVLVVEWRHRLDNIERGFAIAATRLPAR